MSHRQTDIRQKTAQQSQVSFEVREIMSLLTALENRSTREAPRHVH